MTLASSGTPALSLPLPGASFGQAISRFYAKYAVFSGRASRSEYWWIALFQAIVYSVLGILALLGGQNGEPGPLSIIALVVMGVFWLGNILPAIALSVRRFHDGGYSGWLYLLNLIPSLGGVIVFVFMLLPSNPQGARYDA
ncbi:DUF805 domain-containing protein [Agromyces atrinae]|uniref:DUF805 domain-containing protein n=1 Tax=Agromyces atrinae TaxID=592376 RepID=A0A4Q2M007_9MICO|nr:DUF805 domain-containing protein [Agromyces atrinae]NYD65588.1 uncharacterized membrane protein YhaH (DUF805 family) [Agromyces atrinae]RXZ85018.1 DUF805 domain-containing protein [Agromyces atrinae]